MKNINIFGQRFGRLVAVKKLFQNKYYNWVWEFVCDCGNTTTTTTCTVRSGKKQSCGCLHKEILIKNNKFLKKTHGLCGTRFHTTFDSMRTRCKNHKSYTKFGIKVEWKSFNEFKDDMYDSYIIHFKKHGGVNTTIERIDNDKNYCKENCRWATRKEQANNRRHKI